MPHTQGGWVWRHVCGAQWLRHPEIPKGKPLRQQARELAAFNVRGSLPHWGHVFSPCVGWRAGHVWVQGALWAAGAAPREAWNVANMPSMPPGWPSIPERVLTMVPTGCLMGMCWGCVTVSHR